MITFQKMERMMGKETTINFDNGIFLDKRYKTIVVGQIKNEQLVWLDDFNKLSDKDRELLRKMLLSRKVIREFELKFHLQPEPVVEKKHKKEQVIEQPSEEPLKHYEI